MDTDVEVKVEEGSCKEKEESSDKVHINDPRADLAAEFTPFGGQSSDFTPSVGIRIDGLKAQKVKVTRDFYQ